MTILENEPPDHVERIHRLYHTLQSRSQNVSFHVSAQAQDYASMASPHAPWRPVNVGILRPFNRSEILRSFHVMLPAPSTPREAKFSGLWDVSTIFHSCPNLRSLGIHLVHRGQSRLTPLEIQEFTCCHLPLTPHQRLPPLEELKLINYCWRNNHAATWERCMDWTKLERLDLRNSANLSDRGFSCYNMSFFTRFVGKLPALRHLRTGFFLSGPGHTPAGQGYSAMQSFIEQVPALESLSLIGSLYQNRNLFQCERTVLEMLLQHGATLKSLEYLGSNVSDNRTLWNSKSLNLIRRQCRQLSSLSLNVEDMGAYGILGPRFTLGSVSEQLGRIMESQKPDSVILALARMPQLRHLTIHTEITEHEVLKTDHELTFPSIRRLFNLLQLYRSGHPLDTLTIHGMSCTRIDQRVRPSDSPTVTWHCRYAERDDQRGKLDLEVQRGRDGDAQAEVQQGFHATKRWRKTYWIHEPFTKG